MSEAEGREEGVSAPRMLARAVAEGGPLTVPVGTEDGVAEKLPPLLRVATIETV